MSGNARMSGHDWWVCRAIRHHDWRWHHAMHLYRCEQCGKRKIGAPPW